MFGASREFGIAVGVLLALVCSTLRQTAALGAEDQVLPDGVRAVWDLGAAYREKTPTRERVCINGLWQWQPAKEMADTVPADGWGYFKVPGCWPGITDYMQKDCQTLYAHPSWKDVKLGEVTAAWYQREITVPADWTGRRITVYAEYLNSFATVYVDGRKAGEMRFPWGEVDLTAACAPGSKHVLSVLVLAMPLKAVMMSYSDTMGAKEVRGQVERRGLCGDVYLVGTPQGARITDVMVQTSVRKWEITFDAALEGLGADGQYALRAVITDKGRKVEELASDAFKGADLKGGRIAFTRSWRPEKLWDLDTPQNKYKVEVSLTDAGGKLLDAALPITFGFREFWIEGRDFYLNGSRIFLCGVPLNNPQIGAAQATYGGVRETLERLKGFGVNYVYTHNYGCEPGTHLTFEEALKAADEEGMLVGVSQPHFGQYDWKAPDADQTNGYARHAAFYVHVAGNHPSVVFYPMSHNATGYGDDMNPDMIDGITDPRPDWAKNSVKPALRAEAIVESMDPTRIVYHHSSGNLSAMYTLNFYLNFTPIQELSDWFVHWATKGVKPLFTCEYGVPGSLDWTMYRGWYKGKRDFGSAALPYEFCVAEWNSQFLGPQAFKISEAEKKDLRWEAQKFRAGALWHRWDYPYPPDSSAFRERYPVYAMYITDNYRAFRTLGMSATNVWEYGLFWTLRDGVNKGRKELKVEWDKLQRPGLSPDYLESPFEWMDVAYERSDWVPTVAAEALIRNNMPLLAYIGGKAGAVTAKDHDFSPGETVEKQLVMINNSRRPVTCQCSWSFALPQAVSGTKQVSIETGQLAFVPISITLPADTRPGEYALSATVTFSNGETQKDSFVIDVLARAAALQGTGKVALFDPKGETGKLLSALGAQCQSVEASADLTGYDTLIVGKGALTAEGPAPDIARVRDGLKVIIFEQTSDVLEKRFGFRTEEYGLRWVFKRVPDHPLLRDVSDAALWNWRGAATLLPPRLSYEMHPYTGAPMVKWCDITVSHVYRAGNRGNVASVLIEKPACGDFMPILDGGYSLQFSPLMEYREGKGMVLFCQMDVTGRTEADPAAQTLAYNVVAYVSGWKPSPSRTVLYVGDADGKRQLERAGFSPADYAGGKPSADQVLVVGSGGAKTLGANAVAIGDFVKAGGDILAMGLDEQEANAFLPDKVSMKKGEHIAAYFDPFGKDSLLAGVSPADVHNRDPRDLPLVTGGAAVIGDGVLAKAQNANVVFCQLVPWTFDVGKANTKRTFRRASFLMTRVLASMGAADATPLLERFHSPVEAAKAEKRWLNGFYLDQPEEWDDPYRFFCW